jgi:nitrate reductase gamma subunit
MGNDRWSASARESVKLKERSMLVTVKFVVGIIGLYLIAIALMWMLMPETIAAQFAITLDGVQGLNTGRGDIGGMFLAAGILCLLGLRNHQSASVFLYSGSILMAAIAFGRVVGFVADGMVPMTVVPFIVELGFIVAMSGLAYLHVQRESQRIISDR